MVTYISQWVRNLAGALIFFTIMMQMLPEDHYRKYIRFFSGMILILLFVEPFMNILQMKLKWNDLSVRLDERQLIQEMQGVYVEDDEIGQRAEGVKEENGCVVEKNQGGE